MQTDSEAPPRVAVIIPFFQVKPGLLLAAVQSAIAQIGAAPVIIVVDDSSPIDAEAELAVLTRSAACPVTIVRQDNAGPGAARNRGLSLVPADVECVAFLDSDDVWLPGHLARAMAAFADGADLYFTDFLPLNSDRSTFDLCGFPSALPGPALDGVQVFAGDLFDVLLRRSPIGTSTVVYRKAVANHGFPERFSYGEDVFFWMHLAASSKRVMFSTDSGARYGAGVNIAAAATWGTPAILLKLHSEYRFHRAVADQFALNGEQTTWSNYSRSGVFRSFVANAAHRLRRVKPVSARALVELTCLEAKRRLQRFVKRGRPALSAATSRSIAER